jgi:hypothetical protein
MADKKKKLMSGKNKKSDKKKPISVKSKKTGKK